MNLDPFYPVVGDAGWVARVVDRGARLVQLRMKDVEPLDRMAQARRARDICRAAGAVLVLNDYWDLALSESIDVVHLGQEDLDDADLPALRRAGIRVVPVTLRGDRGVIGR